ncbi:hypothetical protein EWM64_g1562 [Hericium alpestre]|uniref:phosphogluconate dehydrogenase (NADP(+)-dependent, decarboxylating) n=1 Tax=Hericium alpestre TaxID=135208 RepID=A0A4Z0A802_9AGAM|nr:hypothetical protein EWM64_g1562 [Hericium alpestre]
MQNNIIYKKIAIVGAGSMGTMMSQLFAEADLDVSIFDVKGENVDIAIELARENPKVRGKIHGFKEYGPFVGSLGDEGGRLFLLSITHGWPADNVLNEIGKYLKPGDIVLDGGNEFYLESGDPDALDKVMPLLETVAAKDGNGRPCVRKMGPDGAGHYVKMVHNGIEQGMMSALCEAWGLLRYNMDLEMDEIGQIFSQWDRKGELRDNFLCDIGADISCRRPASDKRKYVLDEVMDKVVQDDDDSEGTGIWTVMEAARNHIAAPTIASGHFFRVASGSRAERLSVRRNLALSPASGVTVEDKAAFIEDLRLALYATFLASYVQGMNLISRQSHAAKWGTKLTDCLAVWRAGCIITSDDIIDRLQPIAEAKEGDIANLLEDPSIGKEFLRTYGPLKRVVAKAVEWDAYAPSVSATLEWVKYCGGEVLPTQFMEAELDYFGAHQYDKWGEEPGKAMTGKHHYEWKPA